MKRKMHMQVILLLLAFSQCSFGRDVFVSVSSGQYGHGLFRQFQDECYAIIPKHVIAIPGEITVIAPGGERASADVFKVDPSADLALLRVDHSKRAFCGDLGASVSKRAIHDALDGVQEASLHAVRADGSSDRIKVTIVVVGDESIIVSSPVVGELQKGMSGSSLSVNGTLVGMLIGVDKRGNGVVYRQDIIEDYWNRAKPSVDDCSLGCAFILSPANRVEVYQPSETQGDDSTVRVTQTHFDYVYQVPEGWPTPPYFHMWQDRIEVAAAGAGAPQATTTTSNFSFSSERSNRAADVTISSPGFEALGEASSIVNFGGKTWMVRVSQERSSTELQVSIKPWVSSYAIQ